MSSQKQNSGSTIRNEGYKLRRKADLLLAKSKRLKKIGNKMYDEGTLSKQDNRVLCNTLRRKSREFVAEGNSIYIKAVAMMDKANTMIDEGNRLIGESDERECSQYS